jgi:hypothetical protein
MKRNFWFFPAMERKHVVACIAVLGFAAMYAMSQIRPYSCRDLKRIQYEYFVQLKPLREKVETLDDPRACKMAKDEILPVLEQYKGDLDWFENCRWSQDNVRDARDRFDKFYREAHEGYRIYCVPLGM